MIIRIWLSELRSTTKFPRATESQKRHLKAYLSSQGVCLGFDSLLQSESKNKNRQTGLDKNREQIGCTPRGEKSLHFSYLQKARPFLIPSLFSALSSCLCSTDKTKKRAREVEIKLFLATASLGEGFVLLTWSKSSVVPWIFRDEIGNKTHAEASTQTLLPNLSLELPQEGWFSLSQTMESIAVA